MDKLEKMQVFVEVAKHKSFVAASEYMNLSAPSVTRFIASLEEDLGVKLFNRTTRHVRLTEPGKRFLHDVKRILELMEEAEASATGIYKEPKGTLTITAPVSFGERHIMPIITEYLENNPLVSVKAVFLDRITSLVEEELDIAIRIGHLKDSNLYATSVGTVRRVICGSPNYFKKYGKPQKPSDLNQHNIIFNSAYRPAMIWTFEKNGKKESVKLNPKLVCNQVGASIKAAKEGYGITHMMSYQVSEEIERGSLELVLEDYEEAPLPIHIIHLEGRRANAKIRSFIDLTTKRLKDTSFTSSK